MPAHHATVDGRDETLQFVRGTEAGEQTDHGEKSVV